MNFTGYSFRNYLLKKIKVREQCVKPFNAKYHNVCGKDGATILRLVDLALMFDLIIK